MKRKEKERKTKMKLYKGWEKREKFVFTTEKKRKESCVKDGRGKKRKENVCRMEKKRKCL
jgi:hypothetical protein